MLPRARPPTDLAPDARASRAGRSAVVALAAAALSALYFSLGAGLVSVEWADEGQLVYPAWLVAEGARPYDAFQHIYGPSLFWVNGALLEWFGPSLGVLRGAVVVWKALAIGLVFWLARRSASTGVALALSGAVALVWGAPWPFFVSPYASYPALVFGLAGLAALAARPARPLLACLAAGLGIGVAATFKQTTGFVFGLVALVELASEPPVRAGATRPRESDRRASWLRPLLLVAALALAASLLLHRSGVAHGLALGAPWAAAVGARLVAELRTCEPRGAMQRATALRVGALALGAGVPLLLCGLYFASRGLLGRLLSDTVIALPRAVDFYVPVPPPSVAGVLWTALLAGVGLALRGAARTAGRGSGARWPWLALPAGVAIVCGVALAGPALGLWGGVGWRAGVADLFALLPFVATWAALATWALRPGTRSSGRARLPALLAAGGLLLLHPVADIWHVYLALPFFVPALALVAERLLPQPAALRAAGCAALLAAAAPFPLSLARAWAEPGLPIHGVPRAAGARIRDAEGAHRIELVRRLLSPELRDRDVFVLTGQSMVYFLAERRSPADESEFALYLVGFDLIAADEARERLDQRALVERLARSDALVVEELARDAGLRARRTFPRLAAFLDERYRVAWRRGSVRLLEPVRRPAVKASPGTP